MKKRFILINTVVACTLMLGGCVHQMAGEAVPTTKNHYQPTNPDQVMVYHKADMPRHYKVIGHVSAENHTMLGMKLTEDRIMWQLKKEAASLGANGIKHVKTEEHKTKAEAIIVK